MRGADVQQSEMFSYISAEKRVPKDHPLRAIRVMVDEALGRMSKRFSRMYSKIGRPSIPPEKLLRALLLQALYTVRSERQLMEQLDYNLLYRWFVGLNMDEEVWHPTVYSKNRDRLLEGEVANSFLAEVIEQAREAGLVSEEHFTVDGTLIEAWASQKSFKRKEDGGEDGPGEDGSNPTIDFHGEKRSNKTHQSTTDPEARLYKKGKGKEAKLGYLGHILMENRHGLPVGVMVTEATGTAEREAAGELIDEIPGDHRVTVGADKAYDTRDFVAELREKNATPHVAQNNKRRRSAIDERTTRHPGYEVSQRKRKRVEEIFGWIKTIGLMGKTRHRGTDLVEWMFTFATAGYLLVRMKNLSAG